MPLQRRTDTGDLLKVASGSLANECCCSAECVPGCGDAQDTLSGYPIGSLNGLDGGVENGVCWDAWFAGTLANGTEGVEAGPKVVLTAPDLGNGDHCTAGRLIYHSGVGLIQLFLKAVTVSQLTIGEGRNIIMGDAAFALRSDSDFMLMFYGAGFGGGAHFNWTNRDMMFEVNLSTGQMKFYDAPGGTMNPLAPPAAAVTYTPSAAPTVISQFEITDGGPTDPGDHFSIEFSEARVLNPC